MSIRDALSRWAVGRSAGPAPFGHKLSEIVERAGSQRKAALELGVHRRTLGRWLQDGASPKVQAAQGGRVESTYRRVSESAAAKAARGKTELTVKAVMPKQGGKGGGTEVRTIRLKMRPGAIGRMIDAHLAGDDRAAAAAFRGGIRDAWYRDVAFGEWLDDEDASDLAYEGDGGDYQVAVASFG